MKRKTAFAGILVLAVLACAGCNADLDAFLRENLPNKNALVPSLGGLSSGQYAVGDTVTLTVTVYNAAAIAAQYGTLTYQWYSGSAPLPGQTSASYTPSTAAEGPFSYSVTVTNTIPDNGDGGTKSAAATRTVSVAVLGADDLEDFAPGTITYEAVDSGVDGSTALMDCLDDILDVPGNYAVTVTGTTNDITGGGDNWIRVLDIQPGVTLSLRGTGNIIKTNDFRIQVKNGAKLILRDVTLDGAGKNFSVVWVETGGTFVMESGVITNNNNGSGSGGGVHIASESTFTMNGGTISGNYAGSGSGGAGVYVSANGTFTMTDGIISGNTNGPGAGVLVDGTFNMTGGIITGNTAGSNRGGGVLVRSSGTFNLDPPAGTGNIYGNTAPAGQGPDVCNEGTFLINGVPGGSYP